MLRMENLLTSAVRDGQRRVQVGVKLLYMDNTFCCQALSGSVEGVLRLHLFDAAAKGT